MTSIVAFEDKDVRVELVFKQDERGMEIVARRHGGAKPIYFGRVNLAPDGMRRRILALNSGGTFKRVQVPTRSSSSLE